MSLEDMIGLDLKLRGAVMLGLTVTDDYIMKDGRFYHRIVFRKGLTVVDTILTENVKQDLIDNIDSQIADLEQQKDNINNAQVIITP